MGKRFLLYVEYQQGQQQRTLYVPLARLRTVNWDFLGFLTKEHTFLLSRYFAEIIGCLQSHAIHYILVRAHQYSSEFLHFHALTKIIIVSRYILSC